MNIFFQFIRVESGIAEQEVLRNTHEILGFLGLLNNQRYLTAKLCSRACARVKHHQRFQRFFYFKKAYNSAAQTIKIRKPIKKH